MKIKMFRLRIFILCFALCCLVLTVGVSAPSYAARSEGIAVVVNEDAITFSDVYDRVNLIMASSGLPNTQDTRDKLVPQILNVLIDEQIRLQEAERLDLEVSQGEISEGMATIAQQNNTEVGEFRKRISQAGLNIRTLEEQIRAQIAWTKVVQASLRPQITISDSDVKNYMERLSESVGKKEYLAAEIFIPVSSPQEEPEARQLANKLVQEMREGKAEFFRLAQQFSQSAGAKQGGDLGWIADGQLQEELDAVLGRIGKGGVSNPVRTLSGFHILNVREERLISDETLPSEEEVRSTIGLQRLDRLQRRYAQDLKSTAFIEDRMGQ